MASKVFLLDGMALVYRAHFALMQKPIYTSTGVNTSALYGFTQTVLDLRENRQPSHLAVAFDTAVPTRRHRAFPAYKAEREEMPEELSLAIPQVFRLLEAMEIPVLTCDGFEADDIIGTLVQRAEAAGLESYMVTPDKDFGQLVTSRTFLFRPGRFGGDPEILGPEQICARWGIQQPRQVIDILGLMGDVSDGIPGVPGIGEKTASRLIAEFGSVENLLAHAGELKGKLRENLEKFRDQALLSKNLATIDCDVPIAVDWDAWRPKDPDSAKLRSLLTEFEFNSIGRRLFGDDFRSGRGHRPAAVGTAPVREGGETVEPEESASAVVRPALRSLATTEHRYHRVRWPQDRSRLLAALEGAGRVSVAAHFQGDDPKGLALSVRAGEAWVVELPADRLDRETVLGEMVPAIREGRELVGFDLKPVLRCFRPAGGAVGGRTFDAMLAHAVVEPDLRHSLEYVSEALLGYTPAVAGEGARPQRELGLDLPDSEPWAEREMEKADLALQLVPLLEPRLREKGQERLFYEVEMPLVPVLSEMEQEGIRIDTEALAAFSSRLAREMAEQERAIHGLAGTEFNLNSPRQLGEVLFERLRLMEGAKKTRTGQYATDEQTLLLLAGEHEIVRRLLEYRTASKLKSTYADALPAAVHPRTGRVHTVFQQLQTATGRLSSQNPNLQNIPIRSELGQEIRRAFVPRDSQHLLLSADYSQIELRIIAALSRESGLLEAFQQETDVHVATAARVFGVPVDEVTPLMRERSKMVNYGIAYGISAFGLAQRLGIPRKEAASIIDHYFAQFPGIRGYMRTTIESCRARGWVETVTGRRRYLREIASANATVRAAAERNAINAPIQGTAADLIKLAMIRIHEEIHRRGLRSRMLLQVHDELVFDVFIPEQEQMEEMVERQMRTALPLEVPIVVEVGVGRTWLEAH